MSVKIKSPVVKTDKILLEEAQEIIENEGQVTVHLRYKTRTYESYARIWPTTYLLDQGSDHESKLHHVEGISIFPVWTFCPSNTSFSFTLIFSRLPKSCKTFDFVEFCNGNLGAFKIHNISRNKQDVYHLEID